MRTNWKAKLLLAERDEQAKRCSLRRLVGQRRQGSSAIWTSTKIDRMGYIEAVTESGYPSDFSRNEWLAMRLLPNEKS